MVDALQLLRDDHRQVKDLFKQFEDADDSRTKGRLVAEALTALEIHAKLEEEIFYPAVRKEADPTAGEMDGAEEEHHVVKLLIGELRRMKPGAARYDAKFTVLAENVKHHINEEESEMLPKAAELGMQRMNELGAAMEKRKLQLAKGSSPKSKPRTPTAASVNGKRPAARRKTAPRPTVTPTRNGGEASKSASPARAKAGTRVTTRKKAPSPTHR
jgi:hemerythrin-like domain-containing protein